MRLGLLIAPAVAMLAAAAGVAFVMRPATTGTSGPSAVGKRVAATLVTAAGALLAGAVGEAIDQAGSATDDQDTISVAVAATALIIWAAGYAVHRTTLLHLATATAATLTAWFAADRFVSTDDSQLATGMAVLGAGLVWAGLVATGVIGERHLGTAISPLIMIIGGEILTADSGVVTVTGYLVALAAAAGCLAAYAALRYFGVLVVGVVALAVVVPQAILDATDGGLGAGGALLVVGLSIVGASVTGAMLHRRGLSVSTRRLTQE